jgi:hypothetical protein
LKRNNTAADIFTCLIKKGEAVLHEDGPVSMRDGSSLKDEDLMSLDKILNNDKLIPA